MPILDVATVRDWFAELRPHEEPGDWPPVIREVENDPAALVRLCRLGEMLDEIPAQGLGGLAGLLREPPGRDVFRTVAAQLGAARLLRLFHWVSEQDLPEYNGLITVLISGDQPDACALRAALYAVTRQATLIRIFSPPRIAALEAACATARREAA